MSADRLREAAKVLRERAQGTSWVPECGGWWRPEDQPRRRLPAQVAEADVNVAECHYPPNADYIATMHPGVGLALADWLDTAANNAERNGWMAGYAEAMRETSAVRIVDLILGGESS